MTDPSVETARRAASLLRWYPRPWRDRYGDEFAELLMSEVSEQPHSWRRSADVARSGLTARLSYAGLGGHALDPSAHVRASLVSAVSAVAVFLAFGVAMWAQLTIGWQWSRPNTAATNVAMMVMSGAMVLFVSLALLAALPVLWRVLTRFARGQWRGLAGPTSLVLVGAALLIVGSRHFGNGWPGTGGHPWAQQGLVPGGVAAFAWASTLSISSYWAHPFALASFPTAEIAWMAVSPVAMVSLVTGTAKVVRRVELGPRALRLESRLAGSRRRGHAPLPRRVLRMDRGRGPGAAEPLPCRSHRRGRDGRDGGRPGGRAPGGVVRPTARVALFPVLTQPTGDPVHQGWRHEARTPVVIIGAPPAMDQTPKTWPVPSAPVRGRGGT